MADIFVSCKHMMSIQEVETMFRIVSCRALELSPRTFQHKILDGFISTGGYYYHEKERINGRLPAADSHYFSFWPSTS